MNIKTLFKVSVIASAIALAGCGGDIKIEPTVNDNSVDNSTNNSNNTDGGAGAGDNNPCASRGELQGSYDGRDCNYTAAFASKNIEIENNYNTNINK